MSDLQCFTYKDLGEKQLKKLGYASHPRGWHPETGDVYKDINQQKDQAFFNVDLTLNAAGGKGWSQVFRVNYYDVPLDNEALEAMVRNLKKWMLDHNPIWTCVGVVRLGAEDVKVKVEISAYNSPDLVIKA